MQLRHTAAHTHAHTRAHTPVLHIIKYTFIPYIHTYLCSLHAITKYVLQTFLLIQAYVLTFIKGKQTVQPRKSLHYTRHTKVCSTDSTAHMNHKYSKLSKQMLCWLSNLHLCGFRVSTSTPDWSIAQCSIGVSVNGWC